MLFNAPCPTGGFIAVTQCLLPHYGPKLVREGDVDTYNNDADYDSDDVVAEGESSVVRRLRFFRKLEGLKKADADGDAAMAKDKAGAGEADEDGDADMSRAASAAGAGGAGAGAGKSLVRSESLEESVKAGETFSDYIQTEMLVHIHLPPEALPTSTAKSILNKSLLVRSTLRLAYHRLFIACCALTPAPSYFFAHHSRRPSGRIVDDDAYLEHRCVLVAGLGGGALPQYLLSVSRKRRMSVEVVERDPGVIAVARRFFGLIESPKMRIHNSDARVFFPQACNAGFLYDIIFIDLDDLTPDKSAVISPPLDMCSVEFLESVFNLLDDGGVAVFNVLYSADEDGDGATEQFLGDFVHNCTQVFAGVVVLLSVDGDNNRVVACWTDSLGGTHSFHVDGHRVLQTISGPDLTKRLKKLVRQKPMLKSLMQQTRIGLLPVKEVLSRRTPAAGPGGTSDDDAAM